MCVYLNICICMYVYLCDIISIWEVPKLQTLKKQVREGHPADGKWFITVVPKSTKWVIATMRSTKQMRCVG